MSNQKTPIHLLLGTNLGNRSLNLKHAFEALNVLFGEVGKCSKIYETAAWGKTDQPGFLNQAIRYETTFSPNQVLEAINAIESNLGRERFEKWGPRLIDIDILFYGHEIIQSDKLTIPHPEIQNRRFALVPMLSIEKNFIHPRFNKSLENLLETCEDKLDVIEFEDKITSAHVKYDYVVIEGVIGAGKTTLAKKFARDLEGKLLLEEFATNTFLEKFYKDPERYAFPVEVGFLAERFRQLEAEFGTDLFSRFTVSDYHFAKSNIFARINLSPEHYHIFRSLYDIFLERIPKNDLTIYLQNSVDGLLKNIKKRSRSMESSIPSAYLEKLQSGYSEFLLGQKEHPVVVVDLQGRDFVEDQGVYNELKKLLTQKYSSGISELKF
ncbi:MAG: 2-amino-4-hydroxy-6-hydroxymethyldihydropteridine diphosphokinase [Bacteroidia bacterium]